MVLSRLVLSGAGAAWAVNASVTTVVLLGLLSLPSPGCAGSAAFYFTYSCLFS